MAFTVNHREYLVLKKCDSGTHCLFSKTNSKIMGKFQCHLSGFLETYPFQYGPVIKLPLHISQCHMVNHMALTNAKRLLNIDQSDNFDTTISQVFW